jgi:5-oxoprolinase (ATP-hydrolysing) subunit A
VKKLAVDLNSDVGEGYGPYTMGHDEQLFQYITSANIACGYHAGDPSTIRKTLDLAARHGIAVGAHPGYPDRLHFGRVALPYSAEEVTDFILYQIGALQLMAERAGLSLQHVKLHGALYHAAAQDQMLAETFLDAMVRLKHSFIIVGPPASTLQREAEDRGLDYAAEGFADRGYSEQGKLLPRGSDGALLTDPEQAAEQAVQIVREHNVTTNTGVKLDLKVNTLCIHGDTPGCTEIAKVVRESLEYAKIAVEPLHRIMES